MKKHIIITIVGYLFFCSCSKEDEINRNTISSDNEEKTILINDTIYYTGFGYSILRDRPFRPAITNFSDEKINDFPVEKEISIHIVKNDEELEEFINNQINVQQSGEILDFSSFDRQVKAEINEKITFSRKTLLVIAKISISNAKYKMELDGVPILDDRAQELIDNNQYDRFVRKYGSMLVTSHIRGGSAYYLYSYDFSNLSEESRIEIEQNLTLYFDEIFTEVSQTILTTEEKQQITSTQDVYAVATTIPGYVPGLISQKEEFEEEVNKIDEYLISNPLQDSKVTLNYKSYASIINNTSLKEAFELEVSCYNNLEQWRIIHARILYVYNNTSSEEMKTTAESALNEIDQHIVNARQCNNSVAPNDNIYDHITL